jgi:HEPN domain-containing protein
MKAAEAMLKSGICLYAVFMCQQALGKLSKGVYGLFVDADNIPRIHNISRLVKSFEDMLQEPVKDEYYDLFETLSGYYLNNRYPDFKTGLAEMTSKEKAEYLYKKTGEAFNWLQELKP